MLLLHIFVIISYVSRVDWHLGYVANCRISTFSSQNTKPTQQQQHTTNFMAEYAPRWWNEELRVQEVWSRLHVEQCSQEAYKFGM